MQLEMPWSDRLAFISIFFTFISEIVLHLFKLTFSSHFLCVSVSFCADIADSIVVSDSRKKIEDNVFGSTWFNKCGDFVRKLNLLGENLKLQVVQSSLGWVGVCVCLLHRYNFSCRFIRFSFRSICTAFIVNFSCPPKAFGMSNVEELLLVCRTPALPLSWKQ